MEKVLLTPAKAHVMVAMAQTLQPMLSCWGAYTVMVAHEKAEIQVDRRAFFECFVACTVKPETKKVFRAIAILGNVEFFTLLTEQDMQEYGLAVPVTA